MVATERARRILELVKDPEVPVLSIMELGIVRDVQADAEAGRVTVTITPTYSGCPAMKTIEDEITAALTGAGFNEVKIETVYAPAWTTDWISDHAREKLRAYGIAPPGNTRDELVQLAPDSVRRPVGPSDSARLPVGPSDSARLPVGPSARLSCPFCGSTDTAVVSEFGATACKSLHLCRSCRQPFERFKTF